MSLPNCYRLPRTLRVAFFLCCTPGFGLLRDHAVAEDRSTLLTDTSAKENTPRSDAALADASAPAPSRPIGRAQDVQPKTAAVASGQNSTTYQRRFGLVYAERASGALKADVYVPPGNGPFPGVLVVHGGAWCMGSRAQLAGVAAKLAQRGYVSVAISYRLAPDHPFPAQIDDCRAALQWMCAEASELGLDHERIGGFGYSAGAHLVALLATSTEQDLSSTKGSASPARPNNLPTKKGRLRAVVAGGAPCDFRTLPLDWGGLAFWLGGSRRQIPDLYLQASPAAFVSADDPPMFFFHGEADDLVPLASPQGMCTALNQAGVPHELYIAPRLGHMAAIFDTEALEKSFAFLDRCLTVRATPGTPPN